MQESKSPLQSRTIITFLVLGIASALALFGIIPAESVSPDAAWVGVASSVAGIILRLITGQPISFNNGS